MSNRRRSERIARNTDVRVAMVVMLVVVTADVGITQGPRFTRGQQVREIVPATENGPKRQGMLVSVVAVPGDQIAVETGRLLVNGQAVEGFSADLVAMVAGSPRLPRQIGDDEYLVMGEYAVADGDTVRKWGTYGGTALEPAAASGQ